MDITLLRQLRKAGRRSTGRTTGNGIAEPPVDLLSLFRLEDKRCNIYNSYNKKEF
jgi:hypothetical protein